MNRKTSLFFVLGLLLLAPAVPTAESSEAGFHSLFDGKTLAGWSKHMGLPGDNRGGKWTVEKGVIVGDQHPPGKGGFLITDEKYGDFVLRLQTYLDWPIDSGIFLRVGEDGKSHQVTLDYRPDGFMGAIYLPWTQGMVKKNLEGIKAYQKDQWNDGEVRIEGDPARIRFWLNGQLVTDYQHTWETTEGVPSSGTIGLQIHPGESWGAGNKARFRHIRIKPLAPGGQGQ